MLRSLLIYLSQAPWARRLITGWSVAWKAASRFVAGETLADAVRVVRELNARGINVTLDHLGEHTEDLEKARRAKDDILRILEAIEREGLASGVSIKLSQIGVELDEELGAQHLAEILDSARAQGLFVRLDMEDSPWVQTTLDLFHRMWEAGYHNLGVVIQAYLYRSQEDMQALMAIGAPVRLCKGAYKEPPEIAFPRKRDVDANYDRLAERLLDGALAAGAPVSNPDGRVPSIPALATHDEQRIEHVRAYARQIGLPPKALEFQMLYGIRRDLQEALVAQGYPVRVYVPYGAEWYPYFMRRLAERPANLWFFLSNLLRG